MKRKGIFKKTLAVALAAAMTLAMAGCGGKETGAGTADGGSAQTAASGRGGSRNRYCGKRERGYHPRDGLGQRKCGARNNHRE